MAPLKQTLTDDMKAALKSQEKQRLATIRLIMSAIKQREIDERIELDDAQILAVLDKMAKQRRESIDTFQQAGRQDLVDNETNELNVIQAYLPTPLTETEIEHLIQAAITELEVTSMQGMGKVMAHLKTQLQGRADMSAVSGKIKQLLNN